MKQQLPQHKNDNDVERFLEKEVSSYLTPENLTAASFEFAPREKVDFSDISDSTPEELKRAMRVGRPSISRS